MRRPLALGLVVLCTVGCSESQDTGRIPLGASAVAPAAMAASAPVAGESITGTLREQIASGGYTYLRLETANGEVWAAVNQSTVTIGATVTVYSAMLMENFESKTLNRTFKQIYFGTLDAPGAAAAGGGLGGGAGAGIDPSASASVGTPPAVDAKVGKVERASGADARSIGELWTQKSQLADKTVSIRGVVVKYNPGVMGKNWIHLQDGSGVATAGTHDITVTSLDATTIGATVTITGTVRTNKDFGAGYSYPLLVEDAKVVAK